jgi:hypothetical protein
MAVTWDAVRALALALPEVEESTSHRSPAFRVRGKAFAGQSRHDGALWARCDPDERPLLVAARPQAYRLTPHFERSPGYLLVWLEHAEPDDLRERLGDAWLLVAPKRLAARYAEG